MSPRRPIKPFVCRTVGSGVPQLGFRSLVRTTLVRALSDARFRQGAKLGEALCARSIKPRERSRQRLLRTRDLCKFKAGKRRCEDAPKAVRQSAAGNRARPAAGRSARFSDRTSTHFLRSNQLRLYVSSMAHVLMQMLRRLGLAGTELAQAQCSTIRLKLLKIGAVIRITVRKMGLAGLRISPRRAVPTDSRAALGCAVEVLNQKASRKLSSPLRRRPKCPPTYHRKTGNLLAGAKISPPRRCNLAKINSPLHELTFCRSFAAQ